MHIDTDSLVLPGEHILHILNRRGLFHVKGQDVHRLYERLIPFFDASPRLDDLLLRIPEAQRPAVRTCLTKLRDLGALLEDSQPAPESPDATDEVLFMTPQEAGRWLLRASAGQGHWSRRLTCVTVEGDLRAAADAGERARREAYARWLARHGREVLPEAGWIRVYALSASGELRRLAVASPSGEPGLQALPGQLGIVRCAKVDQVPLVVLTAAHPFFAPAITLAGLHHEAVRDQVLRAFVVRLHLAEDAELRARFYGGPVATPLARYTPIAMPSAAIDGMSIAATLPALQLATLDRWAESHFHDDRDNGGDDTRDGGWSSCDLLQQQPSHRAIIAHLQQIVRVRQRQLIAQVRETADGFCTFRLGARCASSFLREKALADLLLAHVWDEFYPVSNLDLDGDSDAESVEPVLRCSYADVATDSDQREALQRARQAAGREPDRPLFRFRSLRRWGIAAWIGDVVSPASETAAMSR